MITLIELTKKAKDAYTKNIKLMFGNMHKEKIKLSNAILVVYIGNSKK